MKTLAILLMTIFISTTAWSHEGHDHDAPSAFQPKKGGVVKSTEEINIEVVAQKDSVDIYFFDNEGNIRPQNSFSTSAEIQLPKRKKKEKVNLNAIMKDDQFSHFELKGHPKKVHRYTLIISVKDNNEGHNDKISFTIEPSK